MKRLEKVGACVALLMGCWVSMLAAPKGSLVEFSYTCSRSAGMGSDTYKLIADQTGNVEVAITIDHESVRFEEQTQLYRVNQEVVKRLQDILARNKIDKLVKTAKSYLPSPEALTISATYSKGAVYNLHWDGMPEDKMASAAVREIVAFFAPWRELMTHVERRVIRGKPRETPAAPKGRLTYCSFSDSRSAGMGKDYCELIADNLDSAKVVVVTMALTDDSTQKEYAIDKQTVDQMEQMLASIEAWKVGGYNYDEKMPGGTIYRVYMEYADGSKYNATWCTHEPWEDAQAVYNAVVRFFQKWRKQ